MRLVALCVLVGAIFSGSANAKLIISIYDQNSEETSVLSYEGEPKYWSEVIQTNIAKPEYILDFWVTSFKPDENTYYYLPQYAYLENRLTINPKGEAIDLVISITDTDYYYSFDSGYLARNLVTSYGLTNPGSVLVDFYVNHSNTAFDTNGAQSDSRNTPLTRLDNSIITDEFVPKLNPVSFTQVLNIHVDHGVNKRVYIQSKHYVVSEPNSIPLVVTGMLLLMLIKRKYD